MFNYVYETATGKFLYGGPFDVRPVTGQGAVVVDRHPDFVAERFDGSNGIRPATQVEMDADAIATKDRAAQNWDDAKLAIRALVRVLAPKVGMTPQALMTAVRDEYRALVQ